MKFHVPEMSCGHCTAAITKELKAVDPGAEVQTDLASRTVSVITDRSVETMARAIAAAGYGSAPA